MKVSNYEITRNRMRDEFIKYDQEKMIQKFSLKNDRQYLYLDFMGRPYRINRKNGVVEWSEDGFHSAAEADFNESMTIYDVLCYSKDNCSLSGKFCSISMLKGIVQANPPGVNLFQKIADGFNGKVEALEKACGSFGEKINMKGDVAVKLYPFSFLPVILQFWEGDEEFPANLKFMFDENILQYLHYETIFYLLEHVTGRIQETMGMGKNEFGGRNLYTNK